MLLIWMVVIFLFQRNRQVNQLNLAVGSSGVGRKVANILVRGFRDWEEVRQEKYIEGIDFLFERQPILQNI